MKKTLIMLLIILLLITLMVMLISSLNLGSLHILGLRDLSAKNKKLDSSIQNLSRLSSVGYTQAIDEVKKSAKDYEQAKNDYNELVEISTSNDIVSANQLQKYEIEYLWTKIGKHATDEDVQIKLQIVDNGTSASTGYYDINFSVVGDYVGVTDFVYDIENDSSLGFKIEKFKLAPGGGSVTRNTGNKKSEEDQEAKQSYTALTATFTCTNIAINIDSSLVSKSATEDNQETNNENTETNDNTNTTNTNTTDNTTSNINSTNTTNTTDSSNTVN